MKFRRHGAQLLLASPSRFELSFLTKIEIGKPDLLRKNLDLLKLPSPNHSELLFVSQRGTETNQGGLLSNSSPPSASATNGEIIVKMSTLLPEALEKFQSAPQPYN